MSRSWNQLKRFLSPQQTFDQLQSMLCARLPYEIRQLIWSYVLGGRLLHIVRAYDSKKLRAVDCVEGFGPGLETREHHCWGSITGPNTGSSLGFYLMPCENHPARPANLLPLLQTCRMIYAETVTVLYEDNIFDLDFLDTLFYLKRPVLPQRLNQIHILNLSWHFKYSVANANPPYDITTWRESCNVLANFTGLRKLTVHLASSFELPAGMKWKDWWGPLLEQLTWIKPVKRFDVFLAWSEDDCAEVARECEYPFQLVSG